jgi:hypothetical protein
LGRDFLPRSRLVPADSGQGAHDLLADPGFVDAAAFDLRLTRASTAIDAADAGAPVDLTFPSYRGGHN